MHLNSRKILLRDPWFLIGMLLLLLITAGVLLGPALAPYDPHDISFIPLTPPDQEHLLGVNDGGMDILSELWSGLRNTLVFGLAAGGAGLLLGVAAGLIAAYAGGALDQFLMRLADVILAIPSVMVLIMLAAFMRPSPLVLAMTLALMAWPTTAKAVRAQALSLKNSLHIKAARRMGGSHFYVIRRHLMPELFPLYLVSFAAKTRMAIFMEASLAFLGLFDPGRKSLGLMINYALKYYYLDVWLNWLMPPIICLTLLIMCATFLSISLERVFDPRLKEAL
jgi:peptide/nickel transport system permease protein